MAAQRGLPKGPVSKGRAIPRVVSQIFFSFAKGAMSCVHSPF